VRRLSKDFKLTVANAGLSRLGTSAFDLMILWIVLEVTGSPLLAGLGEGLLSLPLFFSFLFGAVIDKSRRKKRIALASGALRAASLLGVMWAAFIGSRIALVIAIYSAALIIGLTSDVLNSIRTSWTKEFLGEEQYKTGSSLSSAVSSAFDAAGYGLAGLMVTQGYEISFLTLLSVFIVALAPLSAIRESDVQLKRSSPLESMREGIAFIRAHRVVTEAMVVAVVVNMVFGMSGVMIAALVQQSLRLPAVYMSLLIVAIMGGGVLGSGLASKIKGGLGKISFASTTVAGFSSLMVGFSGSVLADAAAALVMGLSIGVLSVALMTAFIKIIPYEMMARVQGAFNTFTLSVTFFSGAVGGALITLAGARGSFLIVGGLVILSSTLWLAFKELARLTV